MNPKRAIVYARVSSDDVRAGKERRNLEEQIKMGREYAQSKGYAVVAELAEDDRGASGASLDLEQLNRVFSMARTGEYDVLVVREMDRLSRRLAKQLIIEEELKRAGVEIEYVLATYDDNPEGNLSKQIKAVISEYERLKINERMTRGRRLKARAGSIVGLDHALYGYNLANRDGKTGYEVNPKQAEIVRLIFQWYAEGMGVRRIQRELTLLGVPTPADASPDHAYRKLRGRGEWGRSTIHAILRNETYTGSWYYGQHSPKAPNSKRTVKNDRQTWIKVDVPAIIGPELWEATRRVLERNRDRGGGNIKYEFLVSRHVKCGCCDGRMTAMSSLHGGKSYRYYVCQFPRVEKPHRCLTYRAELVDAIVWEWIKRLLLDPEALRQGLEAYKQRQEENAGPISMHVSAINTLLIEKRTALQRLLDLYLSGEFHKDILIDKKSELEKAIGELEHERSTLLASLRAQSLSEQQEQALTDFARKISTGLDCADSNFQTRRAIMETLAVEATLYLEDGVKKVQIKCNIGAGVSALSPIEFKELAL